MNLHLRHTNIHTGIIEATNSMFESGAWSGGVQERVDRYQSWWDDISTRLDLPEMRVAYIPKGAYLPGPLAEDVVPLHNLSVLHLFHQFYHVLQVRDRMHIESMEHACEEAHAWACSLYYQCRPKTFCDSVRKGLIPGIAEEDLVIKSPESVQLSKEESLNFFQITSGLLADAEFAARVLGD